MLLPDGTRPETHALRTGSLAIDAANDDFCDVVDERGVARPAGSACDIGAYERTFTAAPPVLIKFRRETDIWYFLMMKNKFTTIY